MNHIKKVDDYILSKLIGEGGFGKVYKAFNETTKEVVAIKIVPKAILQNHDGKVGELLKNEIQALQDVSSPHVINFLKYMESVNNCYLVFEYCEDGDLLALLEQRKFLSIDESVSYIKQILSGLNAIHQKYIIHRDIKLQNILLNKGIAKICDLGFCKRLDQGKITFSVLGTLGSIAPEVLEDRGHDYKCDFWSIGAIFYQMLVGEQPFKSKGFSDFKQQVEQKQTFKWKQMVTKRKFNKDIISFLEGTLEPDPQKRFGWTQIKNHPLLMTEKFNGLIKIKDEEINAMIIDLSNFGEKRQNKSSKKLATPKNKAPIIKEEEEYMPQGTQEDIQIPEQDQLEFVPIEQEIEYKYPIEEQKVAQQSKSEKIQDKFQRTRSKYLMIANLLEKIHSLPKIQKLNTIVPAFMLAKCLRLKIIRFYFKMEDMNQCSLLRIIDQDKVLCEGYFSFLQEKCLQLYAKRYLTNRKILQSLTDQNNEGFNDTYRETLLEFFFSLDELNRDVTYYETLLDIKLIIISLLSGYQIDPWLKECVQRKQELIQQNVSLVL